MHIHRSTATSMLLRGLLALVVGIIAVVWPHITLGAFVVVFAVYALLAAGTDLIRAFSSDRIGPVLGYLLLSLVSVVAAIGALLWPDITVLVLIVWVAVWAFVTGVMEIALSLRRGQTAGERALRVLSGLVSIALAIVLAARPWVGAVSLAVVFGAFTIAYGVWLIVQSSQLRHAPQTAAPLHERREAAMSNPTTPSTPGTPTERLGRLADKAREAQRTVEAAVAEDRQKLPAAVADSQDRSAQGARRLEETRRQAREGVSGTWGQVQTAWQAHVTAARNRIQERRTERSFKRLQTAAADAEQYAIEAVAFAMSAIEEAEYATLDAVLAKAQADEASGAPDTSGTAM